MFVLIAALFNTLFTLATFYLIFTDHIFGAAAVAGVAGYITFSLGVVAGYVQKEKELEIQAR